MHQDREPQAVRVPSEHGGRSGGDQPIDEDEGVVRDASDRSVQCIVRLAVGSWPRTGHGLDAHLPPDCGKVGAELPVVGVPAARPGGVVDAGRNDDVNRSDDGCQVRHKARS
jgi:hypothetical protein